MTAVNPEQEHAKPYRNAPKLYEDSVVSGTSLGDGITINTATITSKNNTSNNNNKQQ